MSHTVALVGEKDLHDSQWVSVNKDSLTYLYHIFQSNISIYFCSNYVIRPAKDGIMIYDSVGAILLHIEDDLLDLLFMLQIILPFCAVLK